MLSLVVLVLFCGPMISPDVQNRRRDKRSVACGTNCIWGEVTSADDWRDNPLFRLSEEKVQDESSTLLHVCLDFYL